MLALNIQMIFIWNRIAAYDLKKLIDETFYLEIKNADLNRHNNQLLNDVDMLMVN